MVMVDKERTERVPWLNKLGLAPYLAGLSDAEVKSSVANRPTDPGRPLRSVGLDSSRPPVCRSRTVWLEQPGRSRSDSLMPKFYRATKRIEIGLV